MERNANAQVDIYVYSSHLLVRQEIEQILATQSDCACHILPQFPSVPTSCARSSRHLLIFDTHGVPHWPQILKQWHARGVNTIVIVQPEHDTQEEQLRMIALGAAGIISISSNWKQQLGKALRFVIGGELWIRRSILGEYVRRTVPAILKISSSLSGLTPRESQIQSLRSQGCSNKQIADILKISERTVKFHVSNILQKLRINNGSTSYFPAQNGTS
jgi:two-component system response regulator DegU